ncbi:hypothetical protein ACFPIJ_08015 [Dactylosporangium cerinum]|uniref:Alanine-rich protein n=1 Tax=Dactylosporangium cerinum TaxID=1434730 RepID=A0ABV9VQQ4_9ACTN
MVTLTGHAYCWDVLGDPAFPDRAAGLGLDTVALAAAYHSVRAATPLHPRHRVVEASHSALYRPVRDAVWRGRRLTPVAPGWVGAPDPVSTAAAALRSRGLGVTAWVVLTHNTRLGTAFPDVTVVNCFGDRYPYALCPSWTEVRDYAALLTAEAVRDVALDGVSLESCGQMGVAHAGHHDKTAGAWDPDEQRRLSVCCCPACRRAWAAEGADPDRIADQLRHAPLRPDDAAVVLGVRLRAAAALREQCTTAADGIPVLLHASPDPWATGPSPGHAATGRLLLNAWAGLPATVAEAAATATVHAYVTALSDLDLPAHVRALVAAGATGINLYHLGLASETAWRTLHATAETLEQP